MKKVLLIISSFLLINMIGNAQNNSSATLKAMKVDDNTSIIDLKTGEVIRTVKATKTMGEIQGKMKYNSTHTAAEKKATLNKTFKKTGIKKTGITRVDKKSATYKEVRKTAVTREVKKVQPIEKSKVTYKKATAKKKNVEALKLKEIKTVPKTQMLLNNRSN